MRRIRPMPWKVPASPVSAVPRLPCLELSIPAGTHPVPLIARAVQERVGGSGNRVDTVVLELGPALEVNPDDCMALLSLHEALAAAGIRLRLACVGAAAFRRLMEGGLVEALGRGAIHATRRSAVLAAYAEQPGPGLCTAQVRALLAAPAELLPL